MNTRPPNTDPSDPLDADEASLARIVHALPAGDPPAALDARILKASSDALASSGRRRVAWMSTSGSLWGIGSAAAAVLAIGIAWQRMYPPMVSLPASSPAPLAEESRDDGRLNVEFKQETPPDYNHPPPPAEPVVANRAASKPLPPRADQPVANAFPHDALDEHVAQGGREMTAPAAPAVQAQELGALSGIASDAMAPAARAETQAAAAEGASANALAKAATAERDQAMVDSELETRQRVLPDAHLYPESWLLKIRTRLKEHDVKGARASLHLFTTTYPQQPVPDDLKFLLVE